MQESLELFACKQRKRRLETRVALFANLLGLLLEGEHEMPCGKSSAQLGHLHKHQQLLFGIQKSVRTAATLLQSLHHLIVRERPKELFNLRNPKYAVVQVHD